MVSVSNLVVMADVK
jgi:hypothetical protein